MQRASADQLKVTAKVSGYGKPIYVICIILLFLTFLPQYTVAYDIFDVYTIALKQDPRFLGAQYGHEASKETLRQAWAGLLPTLSAEGAHTETDQTIVSSDNTVFGQGSSAFPTDEYSLSLTQPVFNYATYMNVLRAKAEVRGADMELEVAKQDLIIRIAEAYLGVLAASDNLAFAQTEETAVSRQHDLVKSKFEMGLAPKTDYLDARARISETAANRIAAKSDLDDALQSLHEITGREIVHIASLRDDLPLVTPDPDDVDSWIDAAIRQNPSLAVQREVVEASRQEIRRQRAGHYPRVDLEANQTWRETEGTLFGGGSEVETMNYLIRLSVPIFQGGLVQSRTREVLNLYRAALQEEERQGRELKRGTRAAYFGVKSAIERVRALSEALKSQILALEAKESGYKAGLFTVIAVLDAERDLYLARQDYARARYDYILNSLRLRQAVGTLSGNDIEMINSWLVN